MEVVDCPFTVPRTSCAHEKRVLQTYDLNEVRDYLLESSRLAGQMWTSNRQMVSADRKLPSIVTVISKKMGREQSKTDDTQTIRTHR